MTWCDIRGGRAPGRILPILALLIGGCSLHGPTLLPEPEIVLAAAAGDLPAVQAALASGANLYEARYDSRGHAYGNAFDRAVQNGSLPVVRFLWERSDGRRFAAHLEEQFAQACHRECRPGRGGTARDNLALYLASIMTRQQAGRAVGLVPCASPVRVMEQLEFLAAHGVAPAADSLACTARLNGMPTDARRERLAIARFLLDHGADPALPQWPLAIPAAEIARIANDDAMAAMFRSPR